MAKIKIIRPGIYLRVEGKLQAVKSGTEIEMEKKNANNMIGRGFAESVREPKQEPDPVKEIKKPKKRKSKSKKKED